MYVYMYICMQVYQLSFLSIIADHVCVCMHACMYLCVYVYMYACVYVCMYVCMYVMYVCMYVYVCMLRLMERPLHHTVTSQQFYQWSEQLRCRMPDYTRVDLNEIGKYHECIRNTYRQTATG